MSRIKNFLKGSRTGCQYRWVKKHADRTAQPEDLEDWTQDLLIHIRYLTAHVQVPKSWHAAHRSHFRSFKTPRREPASVPELHQPVPWEQIPNHACRPA